MDWRSLRGTFVFELCYKYSPLAYNENIFFLMIYKTNVKYLALKATL
jgi:hypothetical protein